MREPAGAEVIRSPLKRRTGLRRAAVTPRADLKRLCDELARVICMVCAGASWLPPESGPEFKSRTWYGTCARCLQQRPLQWSHWIGRANLRLRHDPANGFAHCVGCHKYFTHHPIQFEDWVVERVGPWCAAELKRLARLRSTVDLMALSVMLELECRKLGASEHVAMARERLSRRRA